MADFAEWHDGGAAAAGDAEDVFAEMLDMASRREKDAVLFLIDCRQSMFAGGGGSAVAGGLAAAAAGTPTPSPAGAMTPSDASTAAAAAAAAPPPLSAFARAVQCALRFYQDKVVTSDGDLVALVLYGTQQRLNVFGFPGVYVFHEFDLPSAPRVQELDVLARAGSTDSAMYREFLTHIGHAAAATPSAAAAAPAGATTMHGGAVAAAPLSDALWAAQHMFHHAGKGVSFRRVFLFTDNDDPCRGLPLERERCFARMRDLHEAGVTLEVFAHGVDAAAAAADGSGASGVSTATTTAAAATGSTMRPTPTLLPPPPGGSAQTSASIATPSVAAASTAVAATPPSVAAVVSLPAFSRARFWDALIAAPRVTGGAAGAWATAAVPREGDDGGGGDDAAEGGAAYCGAVHVSGAAQQSFQALLSDVRIRTYPQRALTTLTVTIGSGPNAPRICASVFNPVQRCAKPKHVWLESLTNALVTSEARVLARDTAAEVPASELVHVAEVGGQRVLFSPAEVAAMRNVAASPGHPAFGQSGLRVLAFRAASDVVRVDHCVSKSAFLHPSERDGGPAAQRLFVLLHRTLSEQRKVAIAQLVGRPGGAPRLVALVPSVLPGAPDAAAAAEAALPPDEAAAVRASLANVAAACVQGCGFHVVPLPYADDLRPVPAAAIVAMAAGVASASAPPVAAAVGAAAPAAAPLVSTARRIVRRLSVDYDPQLIPNPALQRQYRVLQQLALMDAAVGAGAAGAMAGGDDYSLPDPSMPARFGDLFSEFSRGAFPPSYSADLICPLPKTAAKLAPSAEEMEAIDFDALERANNLKSLTIPFLKEYLKRCREDPHGASRKDELVARVGEVVRKRRAAAGGGAAGAAAAAAGGVKRERSE